MIRDRKISMEENMENNSPVSFKGQFLKAMPLLADPNFVFANILRQGL